MSGELWLRVNERGQYQPYRLVNGLYRLDVGPAFGKPRAAIDYAHALEAMPSVSPLRPATRSGLHDLAGAVGRAVSRDAGARSGSPVDPSPLVRRD